MRLILILIAGCLIACGKSKSSGSSSSDFLLLSSDTIKGSYGYLNQKGEIVIPFGKYPLCYTDTFSTHAIVVNNRNKIVVIDRAEKVQFEVFRYDNGPDYPAEGLFRILQNDKIGYADANTFQVVIPPQFDCAYPFENGLAKVSNQCNQVKDGEHTAWESDQWIYIDNRGKTMPAPK